MTYLEISDETFGFFDADALERKGGELAERYRNADPFPHIMIDDFVTESALETCLEAFPARESRDSGSFDRDQERYKKSFNPDLLPPRARSFFYSMNSRPFLRFLENMTGVEGLIPDPYFVGGGFHETTNGGHLSVHADFNLHKKLGLERRLNLLLYLNRDWREDYGGSLELWDQSMRACVQRITPIFNRCVVFTTTGDSFHGHPAPVAHPQEKARRSIALYYYTATWDETARSRTTQFQKRPGTTDKTDWQVRRDEIARDLVPPLLFRNLKKLGRKLS